MGQDGNEPNMRKKQTTAFPILLLLTVIAAGGLYWIAFRRDYSEIRYLIPLEDGSGLFVRKGVSESVDWLVREDPKRQVLWARPMEGTVWGVEDPDGIALAQGRIAVQILHADLSRRLDVLDGQNGFLAWQGNQDEVLLLDEIRPSGDALLTWRAGAGEIVARNWLDGQVKWKLPIGTQVRPFAFISGEWLVARRSQGRIALIQMASGDTLPDLFAEEIFPLDKGWMFRTPADSEGYHALVVMDPAAGRSDTLQWYATDSGAAPLRLAGCGRQGAQITWLLGQGQDTTFVEAMIPALTDQSLFFELGNGVVQNRVGLPLDEAVRPAFNPILSAEPAPRYLLYRIPFASTQLDSGKVVHYGEWVILDTEKLEVTWRSKALKNVFDYEVITIWGKHYLNGRGGLLAQFRSDVPELQRAVFVKGMSHLRPYMFLNDQIWVTVDDGWLVLNAETLELVMVTNKDFALSNMLEEVKKEFGIE